MWRCKSQGGDLSECLLTLTSLSLLDDKFFGGKLYYSMIYFPYFLWKVYCIITTCL